MLHQAIYKARGYIVKRVKQCKRSDHLPGTTGQTPTWFVTGIHWRQMHSTWLTQSLKPHTAPRTGCHGRDMECDVLYLTRVTGFGYGAALLIPRTVFGLIES